MAVLNLKKEQNIKKIKIPKLPEILIESVFVSMNLFYIKEFKFHKTRQWRADYFIPDLKLMVEIEGAIWANGRHNRAVGFLKDIEKYNAMIEGGFYLLRFSTNEIEKTGGQNVIDSLKRFIKNKKG